MKNTFPIFLITVFLSCLTSYAQPAKNHNSISIEILSDTLKLDSVKDISKSISVKFSNRSNLNLLTYGLQHGQGHGLVTFPFKSSELCEIDDVSSGLGIILYDINGDELFASLEIIDSTNSKPMTKQRLDTIIQKTRDKFIRDTIVLKKFSRRNFERKIDLRDYEIGKGIYSMRVIFYCGRKIALGNYQKRIENDCKSLHAKLYQGCALSNKIVLVVK